MTSDSSRRSVRASAAVGAVLVVLLAWLLPAWAQQSEPSADAQAVQNFINSAAEPCRTQPAQTCVDLGWRFAASDPARGLSLQDVESLRRRLGEWFAWRQDSLPPRVKTTVALAMLLADGLGMQRLHDDFDTNHDGYVSQKELLADVHLDQRPLGQVLADPAAVDRAGLAQRLGIPLVLLEGLFQQ